jgi:exosortase A
MTARVATLTASAVMGRPWPHAAAALALLLMWVLALYRDSASAMVLIWSRSQTFTHGFLVLPIVLWLVWRQRAVIIAQQPQVTPAALLLVAGVAFVWLLGALAAVNAVTQVAFVGLVVLAVPVMLGWSVTGLVFFPLAFLFFTVPLGEFLLQPLMEWTANVTIFALRLSGIPVYREGNDFVIPSGAWSVVEACSGVRYLMASLTVGALFAYLNYRSNARRWMFVVVSLVVPVVANWMRAYMIVMLGHLSGNTLAAGVDHLLYGWVFFGVVILLMFMVGARWSDVGPASMQVRSVPEPRRLRQMPQVRWATAACFALLVAAPPLAVWTIHRTQVAGLVHMTVPHTLAGGWQIQPQDRVDFQPAFQNATAQFNATYERQSQRVGLYIGYYQRPQDGQELISSSNSLVAKEDRSHALTGHGGRQVWVGGKRLTVRSATIRSASLLSGVSAGSVLVWQFYWINGRVTNNDYLAKIYAALDRLLGRADDSALVLIYSVQTPDSEAALATFLETNYARIVDQLRQVRDQGRSVAAQ